MLLIMGKLIQYWWDVNSDENTKVFFFFKKKKDLMEMLC